MNAHVDCYKAYKRMIWETVKQDIKAIEMVTADRDKRDCTERLYEFISTFSATVKEAELK